MLGNGYTFEAWDESSPHLAPILALARATWPGASEPPLLRHVTYPGFLGYVALDAAGRLVGYAYGTTALSGQWWTEKIAAVLGADQAREQVVGSFAVTELAVAPERQRQGLGRALMRALLAEANESHPAATLSTECANTPARALYTNLGFDSLVDHMRFTPDGADYVVMRRPLPLTAE